MYKFYGDYNTQFKEAVDRLFDKELYGTDGGLLSQEWRILKASELTEAFVEQVGERPPVVHLDRLSAFILKETEKARKGVKMAESLEYSHLSDRQMRSRHDTESDWAYAEYVDVEGTNRSETTRSNRIQNEMRRGQIKS